MSTHAAKPHRPFRYELYTLIEVMAIPLALLLVFPYKVLSFQPQPELPAPSASCAFVTLSEDEAARLVSNARLAWEVSKKFSRGLWADLSISELPDEPATAVVGVEARTRTTAPEPLPYNDALLPPTQAAAAPQKLFATEEESADARQPFPRKDLLKLD